MTKIKICGLKRQCDIAFINEGMPDYCGFIINVPKSLRSITPQEVYALRSQLADNIIPVGVFVNAPISLVADLLNTNTISIAQLHGSETTDYLSSLRRLTNAPIIQAYSIINEQAFEYAQKSQADYILLDNGSGGTGAMFDWSLLKQIDRPYFLAGGLTPENLVDAVTRFHPYAVDISSGIETNYVKDHDKILAAIAAVRSSKI